MTIGGLSLLERSINSANKSKFINRIIFSTESEEYIDQVKHLDIEIPFVRPSSLATDHTSTWDVVRHAVDFMKNKSNFDANIVVVLQPNCPFRTAKHIDDAINIVLGGANSSLSIREVDYAPEWMFRLNKNGSITKIIKDKNITRMQDSDSTYQPNGAVYVLKTSLLKNKIPLPNKYTRTLKMTFEESINIDESWDFELAKIIYKKNYD